MSGEFLLRYYFVFDDIPRCRDDGRRLACRAYFRRLPDRRQTTRSPSFYKSQGDMPSDPLKPLMAVVDGRQVVWGVDSAAPADSSAVDGTSRFASVVQRHADEELMVIKEGTLEALQGDQTNLVTTGGIIFEASNELHGLRNVGTNRATYFVFRISPHDLVK